MLTIPCKDGEAPVDPLWIKEWKDLYLDVDQELLKARSWAADNESKRKTKKGLRRFLGNWIRRACPLKPVIRSTQILPDERPVEPLEVRREHLDRLRGMVGGKI